MSELETLLVELYGWLERYCVRAASSRAGLEADDLLQEVLVRYLKRGEAWLSEPAHTSRTSQARTLLKNLVRNVLTEWDRERKRERKELGRPLTEPEEVEAVSLPQTTTEEALLAAEAAATLAEDIDALSNPMHQLLLRLVYLPETASPEHFEQAAGKLRVDPAVAWQGLIAARRAPPDDPAQWKQEVADILDQRIDTMRRALYRARVALQERLEAR